VIAGELAGLLDDLGFPARVVHRDVDRDHRVLLKSPEPSNLPVLVNVTCVSVTRPPDAMDKNR
jgi:hypothetical protein